MSLSSSDSVILPTEPGRVIIRDSNGRITHVHRHNHSDVSNMSGRGNVLAIAK